MTRKCYIVLDFIVDGKCPPDSKIIEAIQSVSPVGYIGSETIDGTNKWGLDIMSTEISLQSENRKESKP